MKLRNKKSGFTLIETMVGLGIFVMIMLALTLMSRNTWIYNSFISSGINNVDSIRKALKTISSEIRTASTADTGAYVIGQATATDFIFYSDIDGDLLKERVRYFLLNGALRKGVTKPTGSPLGYNLANEQVSTLIDYVTNASTFEYFDKDYSGTEAPLPSPVNISSIRLVKVTITIDDDPTHAPTVNTFSTQVSIRNLKDNL